MPRHTPLPIARTRRALLALAMVALVVAGCGPSGLGSPGSSPVPTRFRLPTAGLERVMGRTAAELMALFGPADQDMREAASRRLQFVSPVCVLDAYLYPPAAGREPVVTWVDARLPSGDDIDRASCVAALTRR